jgi:hypothetical protein
MDGTGRCGWGKQILLRQGSGGQEIETQDFWRKAEIWKAESRNSYRLKTEDCWEKAEIGKAKE